MIWLRFCKQYIIGVCIDIILGLIPNTKQLKIFFFLSFHVSRILSQLSSSLSSLKYKSQMFRILIYIRKMSVLLQNPS